MSPAERPRDRAIHINSPTVDAPEPVHVDFKRPAPELSPQLLSLVQHIELNKAGWWERTIQKLIVNSIWLLGGQTSEASLLDDLRSRCGIQVDDRVRAQIAALTKDD